MKWILPAGLLWIILLSGCLRMGPDFQKPVPEFDVPGNYLNTGSSATAALPSDRWWSVFDDPELDQVADVAFFADMSEILKSRLDLLLRNMAFGLVLVIFL